MSRAKITSIRRSRLTRLFVSPAREWVWLFYSEFLPFRAGQPRSLKRWVIIVPGLLLFAAVQLVNWLGLILDEILYPGYRRVDIREPLFILGVPRSGTTHLHRVLAELPDTTTLKTWEGFFAPSVSQRKLFGVLKVVDGFLGSPMKRLLNLAENRLMSGLDGIHKTRLSDAEEDYLTLLPAMRCFVLAIIFPQSRLAWEMGRFDTDISASCQNDLLDFYTACLQKHLYVNGTDKRLLSKNAAFASLAGALAERFQDARFICCLRDPSEALPSQLSSIDATVRALGSDPMGDLYPQRFESLYRHYYEHLATSFPQRANARLGYVYMRELQQNLAATLEPLLTRLEIDTDERFQHRLKVLDSESRSYRSQHRYGSVNVACSDEFRKRFAAAYAAFSFETEKEDGQSRPASPWNPNYRREANEDGQPVAAS